MRIRIFGSGVFLCLLVLTLSVGASIAQLPMDPGSKLTRKAKPWLPLLLEDETPFASSGPYLTGPSTVNTGVGFVLTWTYSWKGLASTQEGYVTEESTNSSFTNPTTIFSSANQNDHQSPKTLVILAKATAGTYYYRVRAYESPGGYTDWSNTLIVTIQQPPARILRITNDLPGAYVGWGDYNTIIRVRIASTQAQVTQSGDYERLTPLKDSDVPSGHPEYCVDIPPKVLANSTPSYHDFNIDSFGLPTSYWVWIQVGWWETYCYPPNYTTCVWTKHPTQTICCSCLPLATESCYKASWFQVNHSSGTFEILASQQLPPGAWCNSAWCQ